MVTGNVEYNLTSVTITQLKNLYKFLFLAK